MNKILQYLSILAILLIPSSSYAITDETLQYQRMFQGIFNVIQNDYVDEVEGKVLLEAAIIAMFKQLDPHSTYFTKEEYEVFTSNTNGRFFGIGAQISKDEESGYIRIVLPLEGSPAADAGLKIDDLINYVDGEDVTGLSVGEAVAKIRGDEGTMVEIGFIRNDEKMSVSVTRGVIRTEEVSYKLIEDNIGYIQLSSFSSDSSDELRDAILDLKTKKTSETLNGIILDLRFDPGGLLNQAIKIVDMFVEEGIIVYTKGRNDVVYSKNSANEYVIVPVSIPIIILVNKYSASASEVVSGALQDLGRATILGEKSYGKGSVQTVIDLPNGGGMKITIAKYYTASGKTIHGVGIIPDVVVEIPEDYVAKDGEYDPQLKKALELILEK